MPRRVSLPTADDLFRPTGEAESPRAVRAVPDAPEGETPKKPSGRVRHDEKITVYVSSEELFALEQARLVLRAEHGIAVDRGRMVREAVAELLVDLDTLGEDSRLVRRLRP